MALGSHLVYWDLGYKMKPLKLMNGFQTHLMVGHFSDSTGWKPFSEIQRIT